MWDIVFGRLTRMLIREFIGRINMQRFRNSRDQSLLELIFKVVVELNQIHLIDKSS